MGVHSVDLHLHLLAIEELHSIDVPKVCTGVDYPIDRARPNRHARYVVIAGSQCLPGRQPHEKKS